MRFLPAALLSCSLLFAAFADARLYSTSILAEAEALIPTAPEKALEVTERYLLQRRLAETSNRPHSNNESDRSIRTPLNTVHAYLITAKAHSALGNHYAAWEALGKAKNMVEENGMKHAKLEIMLTQASILYYLDDKPDDAVAMLNALLGNIASISGPRPSSIYRLDFEAKLLNAIITAEDETEADSLAQFTEVEKALGSQPNIEQKVRYQIAVGNYYLSIESYERALSDLLSAYWLASENDLAAQIASASLSLTKLYKQQGAMDKALQHANQAAEFYERYDLNRGFSETQTLLANIYSQQGRYNFALVHYFNALDIENMLSRATNIANINVSIARTYLKLLRYNQADEYVTRAIGVAQNHELALPLAQALLLKGELAILEKEPDVAIDALKQAMQNAESLKNRILMLECLARLSHAYEQKGDFKQALNIQRRFDLIDKRNESHKQIQEAESFKHRQRVIERQLQLEDMQRKQAADEEIIVEQKKINLFLIGSLAVLILILVLRHRAASSRQHQLEDLQKELYTHPRSGLRNLRMLNDRLSNSLAKSSAHFEQWYLGEMIHEPLSDKLSFAMFEVPFLKVVYLQHGYHQGLDLERKLGDYMQSHIKKPARLYHFSDAMFIYIEPNAETLNEPDKLAGKIQSLIDDFVQENRLEDVDDRLRIGMADYPFLPRAFTSINDKELIDILLMATSAARQASKLEHTSHWVHLSAIDSTPAACFADNNVRQACLDGINTGLIKVKTSALSAINWQTVHESDKN
ncbi:GGDEF domain-containing protein [Grimontia kaedaensis]|uniref:GGDEF domain-containing protein n=1 Tax=Grimontia kaedaensis TaxID=2872157 RepID=A0ABY4WTY0_9GAMM|nr:GGDEF domain-containing protein [Grimontia kaedaensis]USH03056.1 GGDEF domain-containing protein [Grimontia kaedaensis]